MAIRVRAAWFHMPACINNINMSTIQSEGSNKQPTQYELEWMPQGLLVRLRNTKKVYIVGHVNVRAAELYDEADLLQPEAKKPPKEKQG